MDKCEILFCELGKKKGQLESAKVMAHVEFHMAVRRHLFVFAKDTTPDLLITFFVDDVVSPRDPQGVSEAPSVKDAQLFGMLAVPIHVSSQHPKGVGHSMDDH